MECKHCGRLLAEDEAFCPVCGTAADTPAREETQPTDEPAPEALPPEAEDARVESALPLDAEPLCPPVRAPKAESVGEPAISEGSPYGQRETGKLELALRRFPAYFRAVLRQPYTTVHTSLRRGDLTSPALLLLATVLAFMLCAVGPATMRYRESGLYSGASVVAPLLRSSTLWLTYGKLLLGLLLGTLAGLGATIVYLCGVRKLRPTLALAVNQASYALLPVLFLSPAYLILGLFSSVGAAVALLLMGLLCALRQEAFLRVMLSDPTEPSCYGRYACVGAGWLVTLLLWLLLV